MQSENNIIVAAAGSGKTTFIVDEAIRKVDKRIAIITYTINNYNEIKRKFYEKIGFVPTHVKVQTWFSFLLCECTRPYQNYVYNKNRIETIVFLPDRSAKYVSKEDIERYYFADEKHIYSDKISEFACKCNEKSNGLVMNRLNQIYDYLYIDEVQDCAGYDFDLLEILLDSKIGITLVGDPRQQTFRTNNSAKYSKFKGSNIVELFLIWEKEKKCNILYKNECYRCNKEICILADSLYPGMPKTISKNDEVTGHDGVFIIGKAFLEQYLRKYNPKVLRYNIKTKINHINAMNFGISKGLTFDRVLIVPNKTIEKYLETGDISHVEKTKEKLYVAITRAKYSVAFLCDGSCAIEETSKYICE